LRPFLEAILNYPLAISYIAIENDHRNPGIYPLKQCDFL
jgi:hypothetical protein